MLISSEQKSIILKIFKIMDDSGDGKLGQEEIAQGY